MTEIILASTSATRAAILRAAGVFFTTTPPGIDEEAVKALLLATRSTPSAIAGTLALQKALAVSRIRSGLVIGSDQTLELGGVLIDKPRSPDDARQQLIRMRGRTHELHSAVNVAHNGQELWSETRTSRLTMRTFSDAFLDAYLATENPAILMSVGAYRIEGVGMQLFERINGDYFAILGLPLLPLLAFLRQAGALDA